MGEFDIVFQRKNCGIGENLEILRSELNFFVQIEPPNPSNPERPPGFGETVSKNFPANAGERTVSPKVRL